MMNLINKKKVEKGFTLIELMIVVAIIGILAAIAIPQFAAYRTKAFNSAAAADAKNGVTTFEAFYTDYYEYPKTFAVTSEGPGSKDLVRQTVTGNTGVKWGISKGVQIGATSTAASYNLGTKHIGGDKDYSASDGVPSVSENDNTVGDPLDASDY